MISGTKSWFYDNFTFITHSTVHTYIHIMIIQICFSIFVTANCTSVENGIKARSHQHQWQVLVGDESDKCNQLGMDF